MIIVQGPTSVADDRRILALNNPDGRVLSIAASPIEPALWRICSSYLERFGKDRPEPGATPADGLMLSIWIESYDIEHVVLHHAEAVDADVLCRLDAAVRDGGSTLWAVVEPAYLPTAREALQGVTESESTWEDFESFWANRVVPDPIPEPAIPLQMSSAWADERTRVLAAVTHVRPDTPYLIGFVTAGHWGRAAKPKRESFATRLRDLLARYEDPACFASAASGAAVAVREFGWDIRIDLRPIAGDRVPPVSRKGPRDICLADLRRFRNPLGPAACTLVHLGLSRPECLGLPMASVARDGSSITLNSEVVAVPGVARPFLRAQLIIRRLAGATAKDAFIADSRGPLSVQSFATCVLATFEEIGTVLPWRDIDDAPSEDERWLIRHGITFEWIPRGDRDSASRGNLPLDPNAVFAAVLGALTDPTWRMAERECSCGHQHEPPAPAEMPDWPLTRTYASAAPDNKWRRDNDRYYRLDVAKAEGRRGATHYLDSSTRSVSRQGAQDPPDQTSPGR